MTTLIYKATSVKYIMVNFSDIGRNGRYIAASVHFPLAITEVSKYALVELRFIIRAKIQDDPRLLSDWAAHMRYAFVQGSGTRVPLQAPLQASLEAIIALEGITMSEDTLASIVKAAEGVDTSKDTNSRR